MPQQALKNPWIAGKGATEHNLLPEIKAYMARARLRRGVELIKLGNRIEALKIQEDDEQQSPLPESADPMSATQSPKSEDGLAVPGPAEVTKKPSFGKLAKSAIFREVVLAKVRDMKAEQEQTNVVATGSITPVTPSSTKSGGEDQKK